jgi:hypothetical protein
MDDCEDRVEIIGITFMPSEILKNCNPTTYYSLFHDWLNEELDARTWVFEHEDGEYYDVPGDSDEDEADGF